MTALNCKVGDLAIVVNTELPQNLGQIVEVLGIPTPGPAGLIGRGHIWQVRAVSGRATLFYRHNFDGGRIEKQASGPVPDQCLRPVSGLDDDDALVADMGLVKAVPADWRLKTITFAQRN